MFLRKFLRNLLYAAAPVPGATPVREPQVQVQAGLLQNTVTLHDGLDPHAYIETRLDTTGSLPHARSVLLALNNPAQVARMYAQIKMELLFNDCALNEVVLKVTDKRIHELMKLVELLQERKANLLAELENERNRRLAGHADARKLEEVERERLEKPRHAYERPSEEAKANKARVEPRVLEEVARLERQGKDEPKQSSTAALIKAVAFDGAKVLVAEHNDKVAKRTEARVLEEEERDRLEKLKDDERPSEAEKAAKARALAQVLEEVARGERRKDKDDERPSEADKATKARAEAKLLEEVARLERKKDVKGPSPVAALVKDAQVQLKHVEVEEPVRPRSPGR